MVTTLPVAYGRRFFVGVVLGVGLRLVFGGQFKQTFLRHGIAGAAGQAAAPVGLLTQRGGSPVRALSCGRLGDLVAGNSPMLRLLCPLGDSHMSFHDWFHSGNRTEVSYAC